jgi:hypothetical protein
MVNIWWHLPSFLVAIFFIGCAVVSAMPYDNVGLSMRLLVVGTFLLFAGLFFWVSLKVGSDKKHAHDVRIKDKQRQ